MGVVILPSTLTNGTVADATQVMADLNAIIAQVNGNLDANNLLAAGVTQSRLAKPSVGTPELVDGGVTNPKLDPTLLAAIGLSGTKLVPALPAARVYHNADQALNAGAATALTFNSERFDNDAIHDPAVNPTRLTCKTAGLYLITAHGRFDGVTNNPLSRVYLRLNGATEIASQLTEVSSGRGIQHFSISTIYKLAVNDYIEIVALSSHFANTIKASGNDSPEFGMVCVGTG